MKRCNSCKNKSTTPKRELELGKKVWKTEKFLNSSSSRAQLLQSSINQTETQSGTVTPYYKAINPVSIL
jgi:hypothetical protein